MICQYKVALSVADRCASPASLYPPSAALGCAARHAVLEWMLDDKVDEFISGVEQFVVFDGQHLSQFDALLML